MPVTDENEWIEKPAARLNRLERAVAQNTASLSTGIADQERMREDLTSLRKAVEGILKTLQDEQSEEIAVLKRRAELPRRILLAVALPVITAVIIALILAAIGHVHVV